MLTYQVDVIQKLNNMCLANKMAFLCKHFVLWGSPLLLLYLKKACAMQSDKKGNGSIRNDVTFVSIIKLPFQPNKVGMSQDDG